MSDPPPSTSAANGAAAVRPPRLPRWTRQEILVLIEGKRTVESRGKGRFGPGRLVGPAGPAEPKWASVSAYCRRHGVDRGPVQCRKRWSNLAGDFKKIKEWEGGRGPKESFWAMRNDLRRERRLPGFFDREVFEILDGAAAAADREEEVAAAEEEVKEEEGEEVKVAEEEEEEAAVFDSGRTATEDGLFSDFDCEDEEDAAEEGRPVAAPPESVRPISGKLIFYAVYAGYELSSYLATYER